MSNVISTFQRAPPAHRVAGSHIRHARVSSHERTDREELVLYVLYNSAGAYRGPCTNTSLEVERARSKKALPLAVARVAVESRETRHDDERGGSCDSDWALKIGIRLE